MTKNEILKKVQNIEALSHEEMLEIFKLGGLEIPSARLEGYLADPGDKHYLDCGAEALGHFLDGLIIYKRGPSDKKTADDTPVALTNNLILKKVRIAYDLKEADLFAIFHAVDIDITKGELSALFRKEDHKKFRLCPDSILQLFLEGLEICERDML
ncbi:MAG: DUF1456 domain-containing protein [Sulfurospirillum sp.]|nr:MAG: DUF1456 domain-containing protein [Sulfurospirillum sp.]